MESEVIAAQDMAEISKRTSLICVSLGSGSGGDVHFLFQNDLVGEIESPPRHVQAFGKLAELHRQVYEARKDALAKFRDAARSGTFPRDEVTSFMADAEHERLLAEIDKI